MWQHATHTNDQLSSSCPEELYKKAYFLKKNSEEFSGKKSQENWPLEQK